MKIKVRDIPRDGLKLNKTVSASDIALEAKDAPCATPLAVMGVLEKAGRTVVARVKVSAGYDLECGRCLTLFRQERVDDLVLVFEFEADTDSIDLGDEIRQELIVRTPVVALCRPDCAGICSGCGANLNDQPCRCSSPASAKQK